MRHLIVLTSILLSVSSARASISDPGLGLIAPEQTLSNGIFELTRDAQLKPQVIETLGERSTEIDHAEVTIPAREPFAVKVEGDLVTVTPLIADEGLGATPDLFVFRRADLEALMPKFLSSGDTAFMYQTFSPEAVTTIAGRCKWYVERHMGFHVEGHCASSMSAQKLARVGFHSTSCEHAQLKVWGGGHHGCGHVAYRTHGGGWSSTDYVGDPGSRYYTLGCYSR